MTPAGAVLVVTALLMPQAPSGRAAPNACVTCHERLPATTAGGHSFQINVSNGFGTTLGQLAGGGVSYDDWYIGFNISRKFF